MEEKKEHWKAKEKRLREEALAQGATVEMEAVKAPKSKKTEWSVVVDDVVIHTYKLEDCEDAHERAISLAAKRN